MKIYQVMIEGVVFGSPYEREENGMCFEHKSDAMRVLTAICAELKATYVDELEWDIHGECVNDWFEIMGKFVTTCRIAGRVVEREVCPRLMPYRVTLCYEVEFVTEAATENEACEKAMREADISKALNGECVNAKARVLK